MSEEQPIWSKLDADGLNAADFEKPIAGCSSVDAYDLACKYREAIDNLPEGGNAPLKQVYRFLQELLMIHFNPASVREPYQPMVRWPDGSRSAVPSDFFEKRNLVWTIASRASHPTLRARLSDISWILDRKLSAGARAAVIGYCDVIEQVSDGPVTFNKLAEVPHLSFESRDLLIRALHIGRALGKNKEEFKRAAILSERLFDDAIQASLIIPACWFGGVALDFETVDPSKIGKALAAVATANQNDVHACVYAYKLSSQALNRAGESELADEHKMCAAKLLEAYANELNHPLTSTHFIEDAISIIRTIRSAKDYKDHLRMRLREFQVGISDYMKPISTSLDISDLRSETKEKFSDLNLAAALFHFANLDRSPEPDELRATAEQSHKDFPFSRMFSTVHLDREGRTIKRVDANDGSEDKISEKIWQAEQIRRQIIVSAKIEPARQVIHFEHAQLAEALMRLSALSPFIPKHLELTIGTGFCRFLSGDIVSALYILTPNLEAIIRYVLQLNGYDTTSFKEGNLEQAEKNLGDICEKMSSELAGIITEPIRSEIVRIFLSRPGPAVRHEIAHGLMSDATAFSPDAIYSCWFIFRLCLLPLFPNVSHVQELFRQLNLDCTEH